MPASRRWPRPDLPDRSGDALLAAPGLLIAALYAVLAGSEGGVREVDWYPAAIFVIALLAVVVIGSARTLGRLPRSTRLAITLFGFFVLFSFASISWADDRGVAWEAANLTLLYFATFTLFAVWPWSGRAGMVVLAAFGVALAAIGFVVLTTAAGSADPTGYLIKLRFAEPVGYPNANAALFLGAAWPMVLLAARREMPWAARGLALGAGGVLVDLALLSQSRGSLLAGGVVLLLCIALAPARVRTLVALATVGGISALSLPVLLDVYAVAAAGGDVGGALSSAGDGIVLSFLTLFGLGACAGLLERHADIPAGVAKAFTRAVAVVAVVGAVVGVVAVVAAIGSPVSYAQDRWEQFKNSEPLTPQTEGARLTASVDGRNRDEFWSVALDQLDGRLLGGMGAGNFAIAYVRERRGFEEPTHPHSLPVRILSQTGVIGATLFLGFLLAAGAAVWRVRRSPDLLRRAVAAAGLIAFAYWFVHAAGDWLFVIPAVSGPAFAWLGMAVALASAAQPLGRVTLAASAGSEDEEQAPAPTPGPSGRRPRLVAVAAVMCALAMLAAIVPPWLAANATDEAVATWRSDAPAAFDLLERARGLNVLSDQPDLLQGVIASRLGDRPRARRAFARAVRRSPLSWYGRQQLGLEEALAGRRRSSLWQLERARVLNPREDTTRTVLREVRAHRRPSPAKVRAVFIDRICARVPTARGC